MELRQLRYFAKVCELGSMGRAALELGLATSALSQQISRLEGELATRLLQRTRSGVVPTDAGVALWQQPQVTVGDAYAALRAAHTARLAGHVSIGLSSTTASVLGVPLMREMTERYPAVRVHLVEALSGHLAAMLNARQLDLAILFRADTGRRWSVTPLLSEKLYLFAAHGLPGVPTGSRVRLRELTAVPLFLPSAGHGLRALLDAAFARLRQVPQVVAEVDGLAVLMDMVRSGVGATIQPGAAAARVDAGACRVIPLADAQISRRNLLVSLSDDELSPAALGARVVLGDVARALVRAGHWTGASLHKN